MSPFLLLLDHYVVSADTSVILHVLYRLAHIRKDYNLKVVVLGQFVLALIILFCLEVSYARFQD